MAVVRASSNRVGDYLLLERLGVGGMAEVYAAEREGPHGFVKKVALKRILPGLAADRRFAEMFCDEARVSAALSHPNIVQVVDFGECGGELFMAMEFVDGLTVARLLRMAASAKRRVPTAVALYIIHETLRGLDYAHEARDDAGRPLRLVHRDVSPGNILLGYSGEVKLSDFGIARSEVVARRTHPGELKGKMGYMSPEQVAGLEIDRRSDLFTVGIVLTELLLLRPLFQGKNEIETLTKINQVDLGVLERHGEGIPRVIRAVLDRALQRSPERRYSTAGQFAEELAQAARAEGMVLHAEAMGSWLSEVGGRAPASSSRLATPSGSSPRQPEGQRRPESGARRAARSTARDRSVALRAADGSSLGIVTLTELMGRVATGRVPPDAWANINGGQWTPLGAVSGVMPLLLRSAYAFGSGSAVGGRGAAAGASRAVTPFEQRNLPSYLYQAARKRTTGLLVVRSGERERRLYFRAGELEFVASTDAAQLVGELLMAGGAIGSEELDDCLVEAADTGCRLGEVLVARGHLRASSLARLLNQQREERLASMFGWSSGGVTFVPRQTSGEPAVPGAGGPALISAAVRRGLGDDALAQVLTPLRNARIMPGRDIEPTTLGLMEPELRCLRLVLPGGPHQGAPLRQVVEVCQAERLCRGREALLSLFVGLSAGLLIAAR